MTRLQWLLGTILTIVGSAHGADPTPSAWLQRMMVAANTLDYRGTFVYMRDQQLQVMRISHGSQPNPGWQQLITLNGPKQTLVITDGRVLLTTQHNTSAFAANRLDFSPLPLDSDWSVKQLKQQYHLQPMGQDRVAGLNSYVLNIIPKDNWRFGHRLWLSVDHGLLLRSAVIDDQQTIREQLVFTELDLPSKGTLVPPSTVFVKPLLNLIPPQPLLATQSPWRLQGLPPGFRLKKIQPVGDSKTQQWVFGDGLATVSVFIHPLDNEKTPLTGVLQIGATNAYAAIRQHHQILALGEVPEKTLQALADSLQPRS